MLHPIRAGLGWLFRRTRHVTSALGVFLTAALVVALVALALFLAIASRVVEGPAHQADTAILEWVHRHSNPLLDRVALHVTAVGNGPVVVMIGLVASALLWVSRRRLAVLLLVAAVGGASLGNTLLKATFDRPRPEGFILATPFARPVSASFPSGHAAAAMALFLVLGYLIAHLGGQGGFRIMVHVIAGIAIVAIGASRIYLGVHYPSDVIAGYLVGLAWVTFCILAFEAAQRAARRATASAPPKPDP